MEDHQITIKENASEVGNLFGSLWHSASQQNSFWKFSLKARKQLSAGYV